MTGCPHENVQADPADPDWGICQGCGAKGFPLTIQAAYGDVECEACCDTGLVPLNVGGRFMDMKCTNCEAGR